MRVLKFQLLLLAPFFPPTRCWWVPAWLRSRALASDCMDPNSQPEWMPNSNCPSSLASPSSCRSSSAYRKNCVAYCEQYLYWFFGPEVPFPDANCEPYETCTFAGQKSLSITNTYSFNAGLTGKVSPGEGPAPGTPEPAAGKTPEPAAGAIPEPDLELAFNLGASYTYSDTSETSQTLTTTRPGNTTSYCGYWTFLPYYVSSCGFYITANNVDKRPTADECGGLFCETMPFTCSNEYTIAFSCTNTTYKDDNGNAEGVTIFVTTNCTTSERLAPNQQDPRYVNQYELRADIYGSLEPDINLDGGNGPSNTSSESTSDVSYLTPDPGVFPTCARGCLCSYSPTEDERVSSIAVYGYCNCQLALPDILYYLATDGYQGFDPTATVYTTPTNLSLMDSYFTSYDYFNKTIIDLEGTWVNISEGSNLTLQTGFECFGDADSIRDIIPFYPAPGGATPR